jgi:nucleotide-binding universal stress UspA family protein
MRVTSQKSSSPYLAPESRPQLRASEMEFADKVLLVATDGSAEARAATAVASVLGRRHRAQTIAMRAFDYATSGGRSSVLTAPWGQDYDTLDIAQHLLRAELCRDIGEVDEWNVRAVAGRPAHAIAAEARALGAALVVMGLRRARDREGTTRHDTMLAVMRECSVPVLATTGALAGAPRRIVVGVDFGLESVRVARAALAVLDDDGELVLAHVQGRPRGAGLAFHKAGALQDESPAASLERLRRTLPRGTNATVQVLHERADVATTLLEAAARLRAECIAVGAGCHTLDDGQRSGAVASALVSAGTSSLLVVPSGRRATATLAEH